MVKVRFTITELPKLVIAHVALPSLQAKRTRLDWDSTRKGNAKICLQWEPRSAGRPAKSRYNVTLVFSKAFNQYGALGLGMPKIEILGDRSNASLDTFLCKHGKDPARLSARVV